ncbi:hypothetical protein BZG36_00886 [Bifiguratus adelaidae]|uniref:Acylphosphatase n=1 Tax=Bifiguratus adelaidae TaxID=1938954 RepID=A0A261Y5G6_9FUNG|nr:hypothetical protein BZG36_00886 [Bifiguratus adelaidae]
MLKSLTFEVFGDVQGVNFRHYAREKAKQLKLVGYCRNTESGSVAGKVQGSPSAVEEYKKFLRYEGSPVSTVHDAKFKEEDLPNGQLEYKSFRVTH